MDGKRGSSRAGCYVSAAALAIMVLSVLGIPWIKVELELDSQLLGVVLYKDTILFKVTENEWLMAVIVLLLLVGAMGILAPRMGGFITLFCACGLLACLFVYFYGLWRKAYDILGFLNSIPIAGPFLREVAVKSVKSVTPQAGLYLFTGGELLLIVGSALRIKRGGKEHGKASE